jgi:RNase P subunit RPR2
MPEQTTGARAFVTTCKNCQSPLVLLTDPTGDMKVKFEDEDVPRLIECPQCRFTHEYLPADFRWAHIARLQ